MQGIRLINDVVDSPNAVLADVPWSFAEAPILAEAWRSVLTCGLSMSPQDRSPPDTLRRHVPVFFHPVGAVILRRTERFAAGDSRLAHVLEQALVPPRVATP